MTEKTETVLQLMPSSLLIAMNKYVNNYIFGYNNRKIKIMNIVKILMNLFELVLVLTSKKQILYLGSKPRFSKKCVFFGVGERNTVTNQSKINNLYEIFEKKVFIHLSK